MLEPRTSHAALAAALALAACAPAPEPEAGPAPAPDPWAAALDRGVEFRAVGQEPGWTLELGAEGRLVYVGDYGETRFEAPLPAAERGAAAGTTRYTARADGRELVAVVREQPCSDTMSGEAFSHTVTVRLDGRELQGCGRPLGGSVAEATGLTGVYWRLAELNGRAALPAEGAREAHLRIQDARVSGATGCNTLGGPVAVEAQALRFGALFTTRMACVDPALMRQEQDLLAALERADRYEIVEGRLTLYAGADAVARFEPVPGR